MRSYECAVIVTPAANDESIKTGTAKYTKVIAGNGGEITEIETWGRRKLAYEINHHREGFYFFYRFRGPNALLDELGRQMRIDESIIRHMIIQDELASGDEPALDPEKVEPVLGKEREVEHRG